MSFFRLVSRPAATVLSAPAPIALALAAALAAPSAVSAQAAVEELDQLRRDEALREPRKKIVTKIGEKLAPELFGDEFEDFGPQFLLLRAPKRKYFQAFSDLQIFSTSNMALSEDDESSSTVSAASFQMAVAPDPYDFLGGQLSPHAGLSYLIFRHGLLADDDRRIAGTEVDASDFDSVEPSLGARFQRGNYAYSLGLRYAELESRSSGASFYDEWVFSWSAARQFPFGDEAAAFLLYDGNWRLTNTDSGGLQPRDFEDRTDHALTFLYSRQVHPRIAFQPSYRLQLSEYLHPDRSRTDIFHTVSGTLLYFFDERWSARLFLRYENRQSDEPSVHDYQKVDFGLGGTVLLRF